MALSNFDLNPTLGKISLDKKLFARTEKKIQNDVINKLVDSMPRRVNAVLRRIVTIRTIKRSVC